MRVQGKKEKEIPTYNTCRVFLSFFFSFECFANTKEGEFFLLSDNRTSWVRYAVHYILSFFFFSYVQLSLFFTQKLYVSRMMMMMKKMKKSVAENFSPNFLLFVSRRKKLYKYIRTYITQLFLCFAFCVPLLASTLAKKRQKKWWWKTCSFVSTYIFQQGTFVLRE